MKYDEKTGEQKMKDWDVLFAILLMIGSVWLIFYSINLSNEAIRLTDAVFYTAPGFATLLVGIILFVLSVPLLSAAVRQGGSLSWLVPGNLIRLFLSRDFGKTALVFFLLFLYMWAFWEKIPFTRIRVPFWLSTFLFLTAMMAAFKAARFRNILIISAVTTAVVQICFGYFAGIPLP